MTWGRWLELLFGVVVPIVTLVPWALEISFAAGLGLFEGDLSVMNILWGLFYLLFGAVPLGAVLSLGYLILTGVEPVFQRPVLRWPIVVVGILGLLMAAFFSISVLPTFWGESLRNSLGYQRQNASGMTLWMNSFWVLLVEDGRIVLAASIGPMIMGLRYLLKLIRGTRE